MLNSSEENYKHIGNSWESSLEVIISYWERKTEGGRERNGRKSSCISCKGNGSFKGHRKGFVRE